MLRLWLLEIDQADSSWVNKYRDIYSSEEIMYRRTKCHEFKSIWTQKGRNEFQICSMRAKQHALRKVIVYLKSVKPRNPEQKRYIDRTIKSYSNMINQMEQAIKSHEEK